VANFKNGMKIAAGLSTATSDSISQLHERVLNSSFVKLILLAQSFWINRNERSSGLPALQVCTNAENNDTVRPDLIVVMEQAETGPDGKLSPGHGCSGVTNAQTPALISGEGGVVGTGVGVAVATGLGVTGVGVAVATGLGVTGVGVAVATGLGVTGVGVAVATGLGVTGVGVAVATGLGVTGVGVVVTTGNGVVAGAGDELGATTVAGISALGGRGVAGVSGVAVDTIGVAKGVRSQTMFDNCLSEKSTLDSQSRDRMYIRGR